jgi:3-(methylthio)propanoyl-CoA dehydrogenase
MANFYLDNSDLKHHLNHPLMKKLVALRERNYSDAEKYDYAPLTLALDFSIWRSMTSTTK